VSIQTSTSCRHFTTSQPWTATRGREVTATVEAARFGSQLSRVGFRHPRQMANATNQAVHAEMTYIITLRALYIMLQATMVMGPTGTASAGSAEAEHKHNTRQKAGRSKQGEKSINGRGQYQQQHWPARHPSTHTAL
jgi:hypothetical protein